MIQVKRISEERSPEDGYRVLVERFWPRDFNAKHAKLDLCASAEHVVPGDRPQSAKIRAEHFRGKGERLSESDAAHLPFEAASFECRNPGRHTPMKGRRVCSGAL